MNDLINTMTAYYGVNFTLVVIATKLILAIITVLLPLFVWSIHNQTARATKELIKLNKLIEGLKLQQTPNERLAEQRSKDSRTEEMVEEIFKENQKEPPSKDKLPEIPAQAFRRRKVFYKPDDKLRDQKKKTG